MVSKEYFCYVCNANKKKMVQVAEFKRAGLLCDTCGQGFCEILGDQNIESNKAKNEEIMIG